MPCFERFSILVGPSVDMDHRTASTDYRGHILLGEVQQSGGHGFRNVFPALHEINIFEEKLEGFPRNAFLIYGGKEQNV